MIGISKASWIFSILLHSGLLALLILGPSLRPTVRPVLPSGTVIQAEIIDPGSLELPPLEEPTGPTPAELERERLVKELEQQRIEDLAQKQKDQDERDRLKVQEQKEEERLRLKAQADADVKKKAEDLKKEQVRLKKIEDEKKELARVEREKEDVRVKKEKEDAARDAKEKLAAREEADRIKKEEQEEERKRLEAKKKEDEKKRLAEQKKEEARLAKIAAEKARKQKIAAEKLADQMAREEQMRQMMGVEDQRNKAVDNGLLAQYIAQIVAKVERNWNRPPGAKEGLSCTVKATQIIGGDVISVKVVECNGDSAVQRSIEAAVFKASPLPEPADPTLFERNLVFIFEPK